MNKKITLILGNVSIVNAFPLRGNWDITEPIRCPKCANVMNVLSIDMIQYGLQWDLHTNFLKCHQCSEQYYIQYEVILMSDTTENDR